MDHIISFDTMYVLWYGCVTTGIANSSLASSLWVRLCPFTYCLCCGTDVILQESLIPKSAKFIIDQNVCCGTDVILHESLIPTSAKFIIDQNVSCDALSVFCCCLFLFWIIIF
jgi:hypothetical protein